jgi:hypothetical protein
MNRNRLVTSLACCIFALSSVPAGAQQASGGLFPSPFLIEHQVVVTDSDGGSFTSEPVIDHYAGSMIVSVRPDESRLVVDFARRELTEIRPSSGTYTVVSFDRMAQLTRELHSHESPRETTKRGDDEPEIELRVSDTGSAGRLSIASADVVAKAASARPELAAARRVDVARVDGVVELWFDRDVRLTTSALDAIEDFELEVLGATADPEDLVPLEATAAARRFADGALPVVTARRAAGGAGRVEDIALRVEPLESFPTDLVRIPEGFQRTAHPLEIMVAHAEQEAELRRLMGGPASTGGDR